jgi:hypothetical protein
VLFYEDGYLRTLVGKCGGGFRRWNARCSPRGSAVLCLHAGIHSRCYPRRVLRKPKLGIGPRKTFARALGGSAKFSPVPRGIGFRIFRLHSISSLIACYMFCEFNLGSAIRCFREGEVRCHRGGVVAFSVDAEAMSQRRRSAMSQRECGGFLDGCRGNVTEKEWRLSHRRRDAMSLG